jgi:dihydroxy-acid dehydratase
LYFSENYFMHNSLRSSNELMRHTERAIVFESVENMTNRIDLPDLDVQAGDVLVLRNAGPKGAPSMPEASYLSIPAKLARQGVKGRVRISDARMNGTAFGTIVLHITPESAVGGSLSVVQNGDRIRLDVEVRRIELLIDDAELQTRHEARKKLPPHRELPIRGYARLFEDCVLQADQGCDFDFLLRDGRSGHNT